jgi:hypothetical protein
MPTVFQYGKLKGRDAVGDIPVKRKIKSKC